MTSVGVIANQRSRGPGAHVTTARSTRCAAVGPPWHEHFESLPWTQTLQPVLAFSSKPSTSNTTDCPATVASSRVASGAVEDLARRVRGVVHREHVRDPSTMSPTPDAPGHELAGAARLGQDVEAGQSVHHRYPLRSSGRLDGDEATPGDRMGHDAHPMGLLAARPRLDGEVVDFGGRSAMRRALHQDTPARVMDRIDEVDLEARRRPVQRLELLAGIGTEDDGLAVDEVVDRNHEHGAGRRRDRDSADRERAEKHQALVTRELDESDVWVGVHGPTPGSSRFESGAPRRGRRRAQPERPACRCPASRRAVLQRCDASSGPVTCEARPTTMTLQPSCVTASMWSAWNPITVLSAMAAGWSWGSAQNRIRSPATLYTSLGGLRGAPGTMSRCGPPSPSQMVQTLVSRQHVAFGIEFDVVHVSARDSALDHDDRAWVDGRLGGSPSRG